MQQDYKEERDFLCKSLGLTIKKLRQDKHKSISRISNEYDITKTIWAYLERGLNDPQFTTLWRISEALDMPLSQIIAILEKELPENWNFIDK
jgi:transcriptional regulator with XRE-family HTH domain